MRATGFVDDDVVSERRHMAVANSTHSIFITCFIDEDVFYLFHFERFLMKSRRNNYLRYPRFLRDIRPSE